MAKLLLSFFLSVESKHVKCSTNFEFDSWKYCSKFSVAPNTIPEFNITTQLDLDIFAMI